MWVNEIENEKKYRRWYEYIMELISKNLNGMMRSIRRKMYKLVIIENKDKKEERNLMKMEE
jgi:hypothetical protein